MLFLGRDPADPLLTTGKELVAAALRAGAQVGGAEHLDARATRHVAHRLHRQPEGAGRVHVVHQHPTLHGAVGAVPRAALAAASAAAAVPSPGKEGGGAVALSIVWCAHLSGGCEGES